MKNQLSNKKRVESPVSMGELRPRRFHQFFGDRPRNGTCHRVRGGCRNYHLPKEKVRLVLLTFKIAGTLLTRKITITTFKNAGNKGFHSSTMEASCPIGTRSQTQLGCKTRGLSAGMFSGSSMITVEVRKMKNRT